MKKIFRTKGNIFHRALAAVFLFGITKLQLMTVDMACHNLQKEVLKGGSLNRTVMVVFFFHLKKVSTIEAKVWIFEK